MTIRLFEDPDDRLSTVVQINCLASRDRGVLVGHVPPRQHGAQLPQDLLVAMGHSPAAEDWPRSAATGWRAARAWMAGFEITELILYGAWRIKSPLARILADIARDDGIGVSLVTLASMQRRLPAELGDITNEPLDKLLDRPRTPVTPASTADATLPLPNGLPPLPPADVTCFVSECAGCIPDDKLANDFVRAYESRILTSLRALDSASDAADVIAVLEGTLRRARNANELLVGVRAFQAAALWSSWHVRISPRDAGFAAAIALDTAATNHTQWPLPSTVDPTAQALAALAWGTAASTRELEATTLDDLDPACATFRGHVIDPWLRPPLRALRWQQVRHRARGPNDRIFPRIGKIRTRLNAVAPTAYNAAECDEGRYRRALAEITRVVRIDYDASPDEIAADSPRLPVLPSARYWDWARTNTPYPRHRQCGLPDPEDESDALTSAGSRIALTALLGHDLADISIPGHPWLNGGSDRDATHPGDAARLHALLLNIGGGCDRLSVIKAFGWSAARLHAVEAQLRATLSGTGEVLASTLDGRLELRVRFDEEVRRAISIAQRRRDCDDGLSSAATQLLRELLDAPKRGLCLQETRLPASLAEPARDELRQRGLAYLYYDLVRLNDDAAANLGRGVLTGMQVTNDCV